MSTSVLTAHLRAEETRRTDRLIVDPYAFRLVETTRAAGFDTVWGPIHPGVADQVAVRTRFYDDYLRAARAGGCEQVVVLGSGLDVRGHRLTWPWPTQLFELDLPSLVRFKESALHVMRIEPRCSRVAVGADLRGPWVEALTEAGFRPENPTAWLVEGVLSYLAEPHRATLLSLVTGNSAPTSRLALEHVAPRDAALLGIGDQLDVPAFLAGHGWAVEAHSHQTLGDRYGRPAGACAGGGYLVATYPSLLDELDAGATRPDR